MHLLFMLQQIENLFDIFALVGAIPGNMGLDKKRS
jgi:hypothetical protein